MNTKMAASSGAALLSLAALTMPSGHAEAPEAAPAKEPAPTTLVAQAGQTPPTETVTVVPFDPNKPWCGTKFPEMGLSNDLRSSLPPHGIDGLIQPPIRPATKGA